MEREKETERERGGAASTRTRSFRVGADRFDRTPNVRISAISPRNSVQTIMSCEPELVGKRCYCKLARLLASLVLRVPSYRFHYAGPAKSDKTNYDLSAPFDIVANVALPRRSRRRVLRFYLKSVVSRKRPSAHALTRLLHAPLDLIKRVRFIMECLALLVYRELKCARSKRADCAR